MGMAEALGLAQSERSVTGPKLQAMSRRVLAELPDRVRSRFF